MADQEKSKLSDFCKNVRHLAALHRFKHGTLATELAWDRTTVTKVLSGKRKPNTAQINALARCFRVTAADLERPHKEFRATFVGTDISSDLPLLRFRTLRGNTPRWQATFEKYRGQYNVYSQHAAPETVIGSLLEIDRITGDGLHATLINPHRDSTGSISAYEYEGYAYPVREYLYFILEQKNSDWELLSLTLHEARTPVVHLLKGLFAGIGVLNEVSFIASRPVVAIRRSRPIDNWRSALGDELGYLPHTKISEAARRQLSSENVTVQA
jgi:hypothetical protein